MSVALGSYAAAESMPVFLGTSASPSSEGIYFTRLDSESGKLEPSRLVAEMRGPGWVERHPTLDVLYAAGKLDGVDVVAAYRVIDLTDKPKSTPELELIASVPVGDGGACHVSVHPGGAMLLSAQYGGGSVAAYRLADDGSIVSQTQRIDHGPGSGVVPRRQKDAHAHWTGFSPDAKRAYVPDLGCDRVFVYEVDADAASMTRRGAAEAIPGGGPRHMKFSTDGKYAYVLNELDVSLSVFKVGDDGMMQRIQTLPAVEKDELDTLIFKSASEVRVHPDGEHVYSATRGHDTITVYRRGDGGQLSVVQRIPVRGATPRNFALSPAADWMLAGGQKSNTLSVFKIESDGRLTFNEQVITTPSPICVLFWDR